MSQPVGEFYYYKSTKICFDLPFLKTKNKTFVLAVINRKIPRRDAFM